MATTWVKKDEIIRIAYQNIGCLDIQSKTNVKQDVAIKWITNNNIDVVDWQEIGVAFYMDIPALLNDIVIFDETKFTLFRPITYTTTFNHSNGVGFS